MAVDVNSMELSVVVLSEVESCLVALYCKDGEGRSGLLDSVGSLLVIYCLCGVVRRNHESTFLFCFLQPPENAINTEVAGSRLFEL